MHVFEFADVSHLARCPQGKTDIDGQILCVANY
jgi:hypothetical protein